MINPILNSGYFSSGKPTAANAFFATVNNASSGHEENQSIVQQLIKDGNCKHLNLNLSPTGDKHKTTCKLSRTLETNNFSQKSRVQLSYPEFFKIEGYVLLPTLRVHLASLETNAEYAKFNETDLLAAFMENLVDAAIHMNDDTVYKKTKYFKRLYIALLIFRKLKCHHFSMFI